MTEEDKNQLFTDCYEMLDIFSEYTTVQANGTFVVESVKPCIQQIPISGLHLLLPVFTEILREA